MTDVLRGSLDGQGLRVVVVASRFNQEVTDRLLKGTLDGLRELGVAPDDIRVLSVPGAIEIPQGARTAIEGLAPHAVVAVGAVIRGETSHYDHVCRTCADGCLRVSLDTGVPVAFGVLTCETGNQALMRSGDGEGNKGREAARVAVEMANLLREVRG